MCDGAGICRGIDFVCPADIDARLKAGSSRVGVTWTPPVATGNNGLAFTLSSSHLPGDRFPTSVTEVVYAASADGPNGAIVVQCSFFVTVQGACDSECCGRADGTYPRDVAQVSFFPGHDALFQRSASVTCFNRASVCDQPRAFLPRLFPMPPMHPPKFFQGVAGAPVSPRTTTATMATTTATTTASTAAATTTKTSTAADSTTRQPTVGGCRPDVVVAIDASGSVGQDNFDLSINFVKRIVDGIPVGRPSRSLASAIWRIDTLILPSYSFCFTPRPLSCSLHRSKRSTKFATGISLCFYSSFRHL